MVLKITPGPLPADGTRIKPATELAALVNGTILTNFGDENFAGGGVSVINSSTDPPATDERSRSTLWFERGEGRMMKWTPLPSPTESVTWSTSEFRFVQLSGAKRTNLIHLQDSVSSGTVVQPPTTLTEWRTVRSNANLGPDQYTMKMKAVAPRAGQGMDRGFIFDPIMVVDVPGTANDVVALADFGFVDAKVIGDGKFCHLDGQSSSGTTDHQIQFQATGYSSAGDNSCIVAILAESGGTVSRVATVFLCPQITNLVHGQN